MPATPMTPKPIPTVGLSLNAIREKTAVMPVSQATILTGGDFVAPRSSPAAIALVGGSIVFISVRSE